MQPVLSATYEYLRELRRRTASGWSRFWFTPGEPTTLGTVRVATGLMLLYVHAVYTLDLNALIAPDGWVSSELAQQSMRAPFNPSYFFWLPAGWTIYVAHFLGLIVLVLFTFGLWARVTSLLALMVVLAYVNRSQSMLFGLDQITVMLTLYLAVGPSGAAVSVDRLRHRYHDWRRQLSFRSMSQPPAEERRSVGTNLATRLIQLHMCLIYLAAGLAKRGDAWWDGTALWNVVATYEFQVFDTRWLARFPGLLALAGYTIVLWEIFFCVLIWNRLLRPLVLASAVLLHVGIGVFMGLPTFGIVMLIGCASFVEPSWLGRVFARLFSAGGGLRVVYDGLCPLCTRSAAWLKAFDPWNDLELVDFNKVDPSTIHPDLNHEVCMEAMQLVTPEGRVYAGYHAFRQLTRRLRLLWPLAPLLFIPGMSPIGERVYRFIAARRPRRSCPEDVCARHGAAEPAELAEKR